MSHCSTNVRTLFCRLELLLSGEEDPDSAIDRIADICWEWVTAASWVNESNLPDKWEAGEHKLNNTDTLHIDDDRCENGRFWKMKRIEWGREDTELQIVNHIFVVRDDRRIEFSLLQDFVHQYERISPSDRAVYPPWVIRAVMDAYDCKMGDEEISQSWSSISPPNVPELVDKITNPSRRVPIVLMSKRWDTKRSIVRSPGSLSGRLAGLAHVYQLSDLNTQQFGDLFGEQWLGNGTIRIFWPGITRDKIDSDPAWNDMYSKRSFEEKYERDEGPLCQDIINIVCAATMTLPASSSLVNGIRSRIEDEQRRQEEEALQEQRDIVLGDLKTSKDKVAYLEDEDKKLSGRISNMDIELSQKGRQIEEMAEMEETLRFQISSLGDEIKGLKDLRRALDEAISRDPEGGFEARLEHLEDYGKEEEEPEPEPEFKNLEEVIDTARRELSRLTFLSSAMKSAKKTKADVVPSVVYDVFRELHDSVWDEIKAAMDQNRLKGPNRINIQQCMKESFGGKYAEKESAQTMNKYRNEFNQKGRQFTLSPGGDIHIRIEPHLKLGSNDNPLRIHVLVLHHKSEYEATQVFYKSNGKMSKKKARKAISNFPAIIIGWCGDHLPTTKKT